MKANSLCVKYEWDYSDVTLEWAVEDFPPELSDIFLRARKAAWLEACGQWYNRDVQLFPWDKWKDSDKNLEHSKPGTVPLDHSLGYVWTSYRTHSGNWLRIYIHDGTDEHLVKEYTPDNGTGNQLTSLYSNGNNIFSEATVTGSHATDELGVTQSDLNLGTLTCFLIHLRLTANFGS